MNRSITFGLGLGLGILLGSGHVLTAVLLGLLGWGYWTLTEKALAH